jgi:integrase
VEVDKPPNTNISKLILNIPKNWRGKEMVVEGIYTGTIIKKHGEEIRPEVTQRVIDGFAAILDSQDQKGIEKYGRTIDQAEDKDYDWKLMGLEELADYSKYQVKEIMRLEGLVKIKRGEVKVKNGEILELKQEIEMLKAERDFHKQEADGLAQDVVTARKGCEVRRKELRELQWRNIDLQNEVAALKEDKGPADVITQEAFEKVLKERDEWKEAAELANYSEITQLKAQRDNWAKLAKDGAAKYHRLMDKIKGLSEDA